MAGFETGGSQGIVSRNKQLGSVLRGYGPPVPGMGAGGDIYLDVSSWELFQKREDQGLDPWGHYLFVLPVTYQATLTLFGTAIPPNNIGANGDYYMQLGGYDSYGINPTIYGPKQWSGWPENGTGPDTAIAPGTGSSVLQLGALDEGSTLLDNQPSQLIAIGVLAQYIIPFPVSSEDDDPVLQIGAQATGVQISITPNTLYTAEDEYAVT